MSNTSEETSLRNKYFSNEIFCIGDIVEDVNTGEQMKILDRGSNYVTVATVAGIVKKWLNEVKEETKPEPVLQLHVETKIPSEFEILESGQIKLFGYETKNFDAELSEFICEQFGEFTDLYSKHQIIKCLDLSMAEVDFDKGYALLEKVDAFYIKQNINSPFIVEAIKNDMERTRISHILASVADNAPDKSNSKTISDCITAFKEKYKTRPQWEVLYPFLQIAYSYGLTSALQRLPFSFNKIEENIEDDIILEAMEDHIDLVIDDLEIEDITETFEDNEFSNDITEGLSIETRAKLSRKLHQRSPTLSIKRERAMTRGASTSVLLARARRLAETMLKRRMFHKPADTLSRQEKERFESGASKRKALVARLAQKLISKVRMLQSDRLHHSTSSGSKQHNVNTTVVGGAS